MGGNMVKEMVRMAAQQLANKKCFFVYRHVIHPYVLEL
ncbi:MAG TPA: small, acid-soluble spore protein, alpha/beta type [Bacillales bacterium]|nr:small, acid-soluble spore protein, alpha/beta type [Bacillales bacterium]